MGRLYQRKKGGTWWGDWQDKNGARRRESLRTGDRKVAVARLRQAELASTDPAAYRSAKGLSEAIDYMINVASLDRSQATRDFYTGKGLHLVRILGDVDVASIQTGDVSAYIHQRIAEGASPHTVQKELVTLRRTLNEEHRLTPLPRSPADVIPKFSAKYTPKTVHLTKSEFERVLSKAPAQRKLWLMVAVYTGSCLGELEKLEWRHVDLKNGTMRVPGTKRETRFRVVPIAEPLRPWLAAALQRKPAGLMFGFWGNVRRELARYCRAAKAQRVTPNDLRRTFASWLVQAGVPLFTVAKLLGHGSTRMVERVYGQLTPEVYRSAVASLPACDAGVPDFVLSVARPVVRGTADKPNKSAKTKESGVPSPGIEPGTRGFSVYRAGGRKLRSIA